MTLLEPASRRPSTTPGVPERQLAVPLTSTMTVNLDHLAPIGLTSLNAQVALQTRTDRKYVVNAADLTGIVEVFADSARVLDIDGVRRFRYESVYFDTPSFDLYLAAARRRPQRFKVRTRQYLDDGTSWIEIKERTARGQKRKTRQPNDPFVTETLDARAVSFLDRNARVRPVARLLIPTVRTRYERSTLRIGSQRITIDAELECEDLTASGDQGHRVGVGDRLIIETKSAGRAGAVDRALWSRGIRPIKISKYALGVAAAHPELPHNRWARVLREVVAVTDRSSLRS